MPEPEARIPALDAIAERGLESVLAEAGVSGPIENVRLLRPRVRSRHVLYVEAGGRPLVVKLFRKDPAPLAELLDSLASDGGRRCLTPFAPPLVAYSQPLHLLATGYLRGPSAEQLVRQGAGRRAGEIAGALLQRIYDLSSGLGKRHGPDDFIRRARRWTTELDEHDAALATQARACLGRLEASKPENVRYSLIHGSFRVRHIFDLGAGAGAQVDWDGFRQGPVEFDSGYFMATLRHDAVSHPGNASEVRRAASALRSSIDGIASRDVAGWYEACGLLRLAIQIGRKRRRAWRKRAGSLLELAAAAVERS